MEKLKESDILTLTTENEKYLTQKEKKDRVNKRDNLIKKMKRGYFMYPL